MLVHSTPEYLGRAFADLVTVISLIILVILFSLQRFGTARISFLFAPIFVTWFLSLAIIGCYNIIKWDTGVFRAFNPLETVHFFTRNDRMGWEHLGGLVLCMTGTNAVHDHTICNILDVSLDDTSKFFTTFISTPEREYLTNQLLYACAKCLVFRDGSHVCRLGSLQLPVDSGQNSTHPD